MPIIRNPFKKGAALNAENTKPSERGLASPNGVVAPNTAPQDIKQPTEYKLSEINDNGVFLPPSPPERKQFWRSATNSSSRSSNHRAILSEIEPFNMSRESFESYRRSFDISARSPIVKPEADPRGRISLDSRRMLTPRTSMNERRIERPNRTPEPMEENEEEQGQEFEDVGLNDETKPKKRGFFGFGHSAENNPPNHNNVKPSSNPLHPFNFAGRRRGTSDQGAELGAQMNQLSAPGQDVTVDA